MRSTLWVGFHLFIFSLVGVVVVIAGLYVVLWGKAKEFAELDLFLGKCGIMKLCVCVFFFLNCVKIMNVVFSIFLHRILSTHEFE